MEASGQSRRVCCCGARVWAQVIGWLQSIFGSLTTVGLIVVLGYVIKAKQSIEERYRLSDDDARFYALVFTGLGISIVLCAVLVAAGVLLVIGVHKNKTGYLVTWIVCEVIKMLVTIGLTLAISVFPTGYLGTFIQICISIFCIWVVNEHRKEILQQVISNDKVNSSL